MLDLIKDELETKDVDDSVSSIHGWVESITGLTTQMLELLVQHREELRYYGDISRFADTFERLSGPLDLRKHYASIQSVESVAGTQSARVPSELDADIEETNVRQTRRSAASGKAASQYEVVRMLLALASRTLSTPKIRKDLGWEAPENEARRVHTRQLKKEDERWGGITKTLGQPKLLAAGGVATSNHKHEVGSLSPEKETSEVVAYAQLTTETKEHIMRLALADVSRLVQSESKTPSLILLGQPSSDCWPESPPIWATRRRLGWTQILLSESPGH